MNALRASVNLLNYALICWCLAANQIQAATYVVPPAYWDTEGLSGAGDLVHTVHIQTIYSSVYFTNGPLLIREIRYRPSTAYGFAFTQTIASVKINLSTTKTSPGQASTTFANNRGGNDMLVFDGPANLSSRFIGPQNGPKEFDIVFPVITPFLYDPMEGNLVVEFRHVTSESTTHIDVIAPPDGTTTRIFTTDPNGTTGGKDSGANVIQLVYDVPQTPPNITSQPENQSVIAGGSATFSIFAAGSLPMSYQWWFNDVPLAGETNSYINITNSTISDIGTYYVVITNIYGQGISSKASLRILEPVSFLERVEPPGPCNRRSPLVISEIMYHPAPRLDSRNLEFVELYNSGPLPIRLDGYHLTGELEFTFPFNTILSAENYLVVALNPSDIRTVYGITNVFGGSTNKLSNKKGTIQLRNPLNAVLAEVNYSDQPPWPATADGVGHSLVLVRPSLGESDHRAWSASAFIGGSPGQEDNDPTAVQNRVVINEVLANTNDFSARFIELYNKGMTPIDLSGYVLTDDPQTNRFIIQLGSQIPGQGCLVFNASELGLSPKALPSSMYLINSNGTRIIDMVNLIGQAAGASQGRFPDGAFNWHQLEMPTWCDRNSNPVSSPIVINEIMYHPISGLEDDQFVELYNRGDDAVNINGWRLEGGIEFLFPPDTIIPRQGYLCVAKNASHLSTNYSTLTSANVIGNFEGKLSKRGERIALTMPELLITESATSTVFVVVNEVTYGTGGCWGEWSDGGGASLELVDPHADNQLAANWTDSAPPTNSPWTTLEYTGTHEFWDGNSPINAVEISLMGRGECLVDDVEVIPSGGANQVSNPGFSSGTYKWTIEGNHELSSIDSAGGTGNSACLHVRAALRGDYLGNRIRSQLNTTLNQSLPCTLRVKARWLRGWPEILMRLQGNTMEVTKSFTLPSNLGTPGAKNSRAVSNANPAIWDVTHTPVLPSANQAVVVTARISDPQRLTNIVLKYRIDPTTTLTSVPMHDDGSEGDLFAGDGLFSAIISGKPKGTLVAFNIRANDELGATSSFPKDAPTRECLIRFGEAKQRGDFGTYRIWMTSSTRNSWMRRSSAPINNRPLDITFVYNDQRVIYNAGGAYNGSDNTSELYNSPDGKLCGYTITFPADDLFLDTDEILLDWPTRDATAQREQLTHWMASQAGLPYNYRRYVWLYVNGIGVESRPQPYGNGTQIYEDLQTPGRDFLNEWFSEGTSDLYKLQAWRRDYKFPAHTYPNSEPYYPALQTFINKTGEHHLARYRWIWRKRAIQGSANDYSALFTMLSTVTTSNSPNYLATVESILDLEQWMRMLAYERIIGNLDSYGNRTGQNMYAVKPLKSSPWLLLAFDNDLTFGADPGGSESPEADLFGISPGTPPPECGVPDPVLITRLRDGTPKARRAYWRALANFVNGPMQPTEYLAEANANYAVLLSNGVVQDTGSPVEAPSQTLAAWIDRRRAFIEQQLSTVNSDFSITMPNNLMVASNLLIITGSAPVQIQSLRINGSERAADWTSITNWSVQLALSPGTNFMAIEGIDQFGRTNATSEYAVIFNGTNDTPETCLIFNEIMVCPAMTNTDFVELYNRSQTTTFDLTGWHISGLNFTFAAHTTVKPGDYFVIVKDPIAFGKAYGFHIPIAGCFHESLIDSTETLKLFQNFETNTSVIDSIPFRYMSPWPPTAFGTGQSLQLINPDQDNNRVGNWTVANPTPGVANATTGQIELPDLRLNEIQPFNLAGIIDNFSEIEPWVELFYAGTNKLNLADFHLSSSAYDMAQWKFPTNASLAPGSFKLIWLDAQPEQNTSTDWHANFRPDTNTGLIALTMVRDGHTNIVDFIQYTVSAANRSFGAYSEAQPYERRELYYANPGETNCGTPAPIRINEWMASNSRTIENPITTAFDDWLELFNTTTHTINLAGFRLTDDLSDPTKYSILEDTFIGPRGFLLVWADGNSVKTNGDLHVNFKLNTTGETIVLIAPDNQIVDIVTLGNQSNDVSEGRWRDGNSPPFYPMVSPTPNGPNTIPNPQPLLLSSGIALENQNVTLYWSSQPGRTYRVQYKAILDLSGWLDLPGDVTATSQITSKTDVTAAGSGQRFYQVLGLP